MNTQDDLDPEFVNAVIAHMNDDHADACLCMVKAFSDQTTATSATLNNLDRKSLYFTVATQATAPANRAPVSVDVKIDLSVPLRNEQQIRGVLVSMTRHAREILSN